MPLPAVLVVLALSLPACATPLAPGETDLLGSHRAPAPVLDTALVCDPDTPSGGVPDRFQPIAAYLCNPMLTVAPTDPHATPPSLDLEYPHTPPEESSAPEPTTVAEPVPTPRRFEGDLSPLLAALSVPDAPRTADVCALVMVVPPDVRLVDDRGRWVRPTIPSNACGQAVREPIDEAFERLTEVR